MVMVRNLVKVGNREVKKRYIGNKLIFEDLGDKTEILSGTEIYTDKADDSAVHVEIDGKSYQHAGSGKNLAPHFNHWKFSGGARVKNDVLYIPVGGNAEFVAEWNGRDAVPLYSFDIVKGKNAHGSSAYMDSTGKSVTEASNTWTGNGYTMNFNNVTRRTWAGQPLDSRTQTLRFAFTGNSTYVTEEYAIKNISLTYNGTNAIDYEPPAPSPKHPIEIHSVNDFDVVSSVGKGNLLKNVNGRPASMARGGSTPPTVELVNMETPFGNEAFKITFPANNNTGYAGSRAITNNLIMYSGKSYSYHTYVYFPDGNASGVLMYPTGQVGMHSLNPDSSKNIGEWRYYRCENYSLPSRFKTANNYMTYYAGSRFSSPKTIYVSIVKFEEGVEATPYSPRLEDIAEGDNHPLIDKINLLLDEPLRSVGDVKDRLFRDSDGLWKIERNVREVILDGTENWTQGLDNLADVFRYYSGNVTLGKEDRRADIGICSHLKTNSSLYQNQEGTVFGLGNRHAYLYLNKTKYPTTASVKSWIINESTKGTPLVLQFRLETPTTETLDEDLQDKLNNLRSFQDSNYVYTIIDKTDILSDYVTENLKPTLHTTFKSKGWYDYYLKTLLK